VREVTVGDRVFEVHDDWTLKVRPNSAYAFEFENREDYHNEHGNLRTLYTSIDYHHERGMTVYHYYEVQVSEIEGRMLLMSPAYEVRRWFTERPERLR